MPVILRSLHNMHKPKTHRDSSVRSSCFTGKISIKLNTRGSYKKLYGHFDSHKTDTTEVHVRKGALSEAHMCKLRVLRNGN